MTLSNCKRLLSKILATPALLQQLTSRSDPPTSSADPPGRGPPLAPSSQQSTRQLTRASTGCATGTPAADMAAVQGVHVHSTIILAWHTTCHLCTVTVLNNVPQYPILGCPAIPYSGYTLLASFVLIMAARFREISQHAQPAAHQRRNREDGELTTVDSAEGEVIFCNNCSEVLTDDDLRSATVCPDCDETPSVLCEQCDGEVHRKKGKSKHTRTPYHQLRCEQCEEFITNLADAVVCIHCPERPTLCQECDASLHVPKGKNGKHTRQPLESE